MASANMICALSWSRGPWLKLSEAMKLMRVLSLSRGSGIVGGGAIFWRPLTDGGMVCDQDRLCPLTFPLCGQTKNSTSYHLSVEDLHCHFIPCCIWLQKYGVGASILILAYLRYRAKKRKPHSCRSVLKILRLHLWSGAGGAKRLQSNCKFKRWTLGLEKK